MILYSDYCPRIFPLNGDSDPSELDRVQGIDPTSTLNREKIKEVGSDFTAWKRGTPTIGYALTQNEEGTLEAWLKLANKSSSSKTVTLDDFKTSWFDICEYLTDDDGTFLGTMQYPKLRLSGFSIGIADPDAIIERSFDLVGEHAIHWKNDNQYVIQLKATVASAGLLDSANNFDVVIGSGDYSDYPDPVADPDVGAGKTDAEKYIQKIMRVRSGTSTELIVDDDYDYVNGTKTLTIADAQADDIYKIFYTATSYVSGESTFVKDTSKSGGLTADSVDIYLYIPASGKPGSEDYLYRMQSATIDVAFDRTDYKEIGNKDVVLRGVRENTVTVTLSRYLEKWTAEEILRGESSTFGKIDVKELSDDIALIIKVYEDDTKSTFKLGYKITSLSPTELRSSVAVDEYTSKDITLEADNLLITDDANEL